MRKFMIRVKTRRKKGTDGKKKLLMFSNIYHLGNTGHLCTSKEGMLINHKLAAFSL